MVTADKNVELLIGVYPWTPPTNSYSAYFYSTNVYLTFLFCESPRCISWCVFEDPIILFWCDLFALTLEGPHYFYSVVTFFVLTLEGHYHLMSPPLFFIFLDFIPLVFILLYYSTISLCCDCFALTLLSRDSHYLISEGTPHQFLIPLVFILVIYSAVAGIL